MNLWFRLLATIVATFWKPRLAPPLERSRLRFRVWPSDLDTNLHMNNGRYLTIMDLGRPDLIVRMGILRPMIKYGWMPVLTTNIIRFRRELKMFEPFELESGIRYWQNTTFVMEHRIRFVKGKRFEHFYCDLRQIPISNRPVQQSPGPMHEPVVSSARHHCRYFLETAPCAAAGALTTALSRLAQ